MSGRNPMSSIRSASSSTRWTDVAEVQRPALDVVDDTARRADDDIHPALQGAKLLLNRLTAVNAANPHVLMAG